MDRNAMSCKDLLQRKKQEDHWIWTIISNMNWYLSLCRLKRQMVLCIRKQITAHELSNTKNQWESKPSSWHWLWSGMYFCHWVYYSVCQWCQQLHGWDYYWFHPISLHLRETNLEERLHLWLYGPTISSWFQLMECEQWWVDGNSGSDQRCWIGQLTTVTG